MQRSVVIPVLLLILAIGLFWQRVVQRPRPETAGRTEALGASAGFEGEARVPPGSSGQSAPPGALPAGSSHPVTKGQTGIAVLTGAWGSQPGQFGRRRHSESNPEAPMAISAGPENTVVILDQVNRRIERYQRDSWVSSIPIGGDTVQDLALGPEGRTVLLDRLVEKNVQVYGPDGKLKNEVPLDAKAVGEPGLLTGVFADREGIYVEREHGMLLRIADASGNRDQPPEALPGRPTRDGQLYIAASLLDRAAGQVSVRAIHRKNGQPAWTQTLQFGAAILHLILLDSDPQGQVYIAAATGRESASPPYQILDEAVVALRLGSGGALRGRMTLPPLRGADESFRPLTVDDQGAILIMSAQSDGLQVTRYPFP